MFSFALHTFCPAPYPLRLGWYPSIVEITALCYKPLALALGPDYYDFLETGRLEYHCRLLHTHAKELVYGEALN